MGRSLAVFVVLAGAVVGAAALWPLPQEPERLSWDPPPELIPPEPLVLPPAREQLMEFLPDQSIRLLRPSGSEITVRYAAVVADPQWVDVAFTAAGSGNWTPMKTAVPWPSSQGPPMSGSRASTI